MVPAWVGFIDIRTVAGYPGSCVVLGPEHEFRFTGLRVAARLLVVDRFVLEPGYARDKS